MVGAKLPWSSASGIFCDLVIYCNFACICRDVRREKKDATYLGTSPHHAGIMQAGPLHTEADQITLGFA